VRLDRERGPHSRSSCRGKKGSHPAAGVNSSRASNDPATAKLTSRNADWPATGGRPALICYDKLPALNRIRGDDGTIPRPKQGLKRKRGL